MAEDENPEEQPMDDAERFLQEQEKYREPAKPWKLTESDRDLLKRMYILVDD